MLELSSSPLLIKVTEPATAYLGHDEPISVSLDGHYINKLVGGKSEFIGVILHLSNILHR